MANADIKSKAAQDIHELFTANPTHWQDKAIAILKSHNDFNQIGAEMRRKDPDCSLAELPRDPISRCFGELTDTGLYTIPEIDDPAEADLTYYCTAIVLHDNAGQGYERITRGIWPRDLCDFGRAAFGSFYTGKSGFVDAALRHVKKDQQKHLEREPLNGPGTSTRQ